MIAGERGEQQPEEMTSPYWRLDTSDEIANVWRQLRRTPAGVAPLARILRTHAPRATALIVVLQLAAGAATTFGLLATTGVIEELLVAAPTADRVAAAVPSLLLVICAYALRGALETGVALAEAVVGPAVRRAAEEHLVEAGLRVELAAFDDPEFYDRMHRAREQGLDRIDRTTETLVGVLGALLAVTASATSLAVLDPVLLPALLVSVLPQAWAVLRSARVAHESTWRRVALFRRLSVVTQLAAMRESAAELRTTQAEPFVLAEFRRLADTLRRELVRVNTVQARTQAAGRTLAGVGLALTFVTLALLLRAGWVPLAAAGTAVLAIRTAGAGLARLVDTANQLFEQSLYIADYQAYLDDAARRRRPSVPGAAPTMPAEIALRDVSFSYEGADEPALCGVNLTIRRGQVVALVGENGSGKTTLAKILAGLYRPSAGTVTWDGADIAALDPDHVAAHIGLVLQEPLRWPHNARTNVRVGRHTREDPDDSALSAAAARARADDVIAALPHGWRTLLSRYFRGGTELSGGQWQRIAVARGLYRDAPLLICDEPTAALDARAELEVFDSLRDLGRDRTVLLVTHRLASVRAADHILVLHKGRLIEQGTHHQLVAIPDGRYADLYRLQARLFAEPVPSTGSESRVEQPARTDRGGTTMSRR